MRFHRHALLDFFGVKKQKFRFITTVNNKKKKNTTAYLEFLLHKLAIPRCSKIRVKIEHEFRFHRKIVSVTIKCI